MRKSLLLLLMLVSAVSVKAQTTFSNAVQYNDYIINRQSSIGQQINILVAQAMDTTSTNEKITAVLSECRNTTSKCLKEIKNMPGWKGNTDFRDQAVKLFEFYQNSFDNELKELAFLLVKKELDDADLERAKVLQDQITTNEAVYDEAFLSSQKKFAEEFGFTLQQQEGQ